MITRTIKHGLLLLTLVYSCGCGGGTGVPLVPRVLSSNIDIARIPMNASNITYRSLSFSQYPDSVDEQRKSVEKFGGWIDGPFTHVYPIEFQGRELHIAILQHENVLAILNGTNCIKRIPLPRYGIMSRAVEWNPKGRSLLVIYVALQASSNSSVFMILNAEMDVLYKEYLTRAEALGKGNSATVGPVIVVKSNKILVRPSTGERERVAGDWVYYLRSELD